MQTQWGEIFPLSGLAGVPFAGKTGWAAFSSHCPEDGNICVLFAPHVGLHTDGTVGKVMREGQSGISSACGAAIGALAALKADESCANFPNGYQDHQMDCIKHLLKPYVKEISKAENEQAALVYAMYSMIEEYLNAILNSNWMTEKSQLALCGGIMINAEGEGNDRFLPLKFEVRNKAGEKTDLFH